MLLESINSSATKQSSALKLTQVLKSTFNKQGVSLVLIVVRKENWSDAIYLSYKDYISIKNVFSFMNKF